MGAYAERENGGVFSVETEPPLGLGDILTKAGCRGKQVTVSNPALK